MLCKVVKYLNFTLSAHKCVPSVTLQEYEIYARIEPAFH